MKSIPCAVPLCPNVQIFTETPRDDLSFFCFPKKRISEWVDIIGRPELATRHIKNYRICSNHFRIEDFERKLDSEELCQSSRRKLKRDAVPSILVPLVQKKIAKNFSPNKVKRKVCDSSRSKEPTVLTSKTKRIFNISPNIQQKICLICTSTVSCEDETKYNFPGCSGSPKLNEQLWVLFLLKNIINLPNWKLEEILKITGTQPSKWVNLCKQCTKTLVDILRTQNEIRNLQYKYDTLVQELKTEFDKSLLQNGYSETKGKKVGNTVTKNIRQFFNVGKNMKKMNGRQFKCTLCPRKYFSKNLLKNHLIFHSRSKRLNNGRYDCSQCQAPYDNMLSVQSHLRKTHGITLHPDWDKTEEPQTEFLYTRKTRKQVVERLKLKGYHLSGQARPAEPQFKDVIFRCSSCPKKYATKGYLEKHTNFHQFTETKYKKKFDCIKCSTPFKNIVNLRKHYKEKHKLKLDGIWEGEDEQIYKHFFASPKQQVTKLKNTQHSKNNFTIVATINGVECSKCEVICKNNMGLKNHMRAMHNIIQSSYTCELCGFVVGSGTTRNQKIKSHILNHKIFDDSVDPSVSTTEFICSLCKLLFKSRIELRRHKINSHAEQLGLEVFKCKQCPKVFISKEHGIIHDLRVHKKTGRFSCDKCGYDAVTREELEDHKAKHLNLRYKCDHCSSSYAGLKIKREHIQRCHPNLFVPYKRMSYGGVPVQPLTTVEDAQPSLLTQH